MSDEFAVKLTLADADHLLALAEWALSQPTLYVCECGEKLTRRLDLGPGLNEQGAERAARKIESVADLYRRGIAVERTEDE